MSTDKNTTYDFDLLEKIKKGDRKSFENLFDKYYKRLCLFSYNLQHNRESAEEIVADVLANLWIKKNALNISLNLKSYLFKAVKNRSLNYLKTSHGSNINLIQLDDIELIANEKADNSVLGSEIREQIDDIIKLMPPKRQVVFRLNRIEGFKYKEIGEIMNISERTVQNHMVEAIRFTSQFYPKFKMIMSSLMFFLAGCLSSLFI
ncbi:RNA polymerase sigma-70 factor [Fulvivirgaceae bacterium BMA12]|uniref:RNA polymerase sigma-70 factor n=1 Tax=Agaribacillus aureus TaxID=3051825 RepID=A0ABT8L7I2_9BACT|nr:RNA polymerase sigma-70 factor [Fulvivirgaceae bacterium BMA12]